MDATVLAAWIAAGASFLTLAGTLAAQYLSHRASSRDAAKTAKEQREQLDRTLAEQRAQLDRTLAEQNQQLDRTLAEQRARTLNERFATAAGQLGDDKPAAVQVAGVYAMAGLADDWPENRQTCVDVLCGYLRMPYAPDRGEVAPQGARFAFQARREVRHTAIRVIAAHLRDDVGKESWQGLNFDFTGVVFDGGDFSGIRVPSGTVSFRDAQFVGGRVDFDGAQFSGGAVDFSRAEFSGGIVAFTSTQFSGGAVDFIDTRFSGGAIDFSAARFRRGTVDFIGAYFLGGHINFGGARFTGSEVSFLSARFRGSQVGFGYVWFSGGVVGFIDGEFSGGHVGFRRAHFSGSTVSFSEAEFTGGAVNFSEPEDWSHPPVFPWTGKPPPGVKLPAEVSTADQRPTG